MCQVWYEMNAAGERSVCWWSEYHSLICGSTKRKPPNAHNHSLLPIISHSQLSTYSSLDSSQYLNRVNSGLEKICAA